MSTVSLFNFSGTKVGDIQLPSSHFGIEPNGQVVAEYVRMYLANQRLGTAMTKTRAFVSGGGIKPYRQKGTGRARQGSIRSPHFVGGGNVFGPRQPNFSYQIPRKKKQLALRSVLSDRALSNKCMVVEKIDLINKKTNEIVKFIKALEPASKTYLIVLGQYDPIAIRCIRNISNVDVKMWSNLNAYDVLKSEMLILEKSVLDKISEGTNS